MNTRHKVVAAIAALLIVALGAGGSGLSPVLATGVTLSTCGISPQATANLGVHGAEMAYEQMRFGCLPSGGTSKNLLKTALSQQRAMPRLSLSTVGTNWSQIGPEPVTYGGSYTTTGRITAMAYDAALNGGTLFVGAADGGVWSTTDGGLTWTTHTDGMPSLAIESLAIDPTDTTGKTIYAGTGEQADNLDAIYGQGVYKSTDGGLTWTASDDTVFGHNAISAVVVDPVSFGCTTTGCRVYAALSYACCFASQTQFAGAGGVAVSTDGGSTWTIPTNSISADGVTDLTTDNLGNLYAAVGDASGNTNSNADNGIWESVDHGETWTQVSSGLPGSSGLNYKLTLADPADAPGSQILYTAVSDASNNNKLLGVYRSTNGGVPTTMTWTQILTPDLTACPGGGTTQIPACYENQAWYDLYIYADPTDTTHNTVYLGLSDVYKSTNADGTTPTWTNLTNVYQSGRKPIHPDQHRAVAGQCPNASAPPPTVSCMYFGNDGGVFNSSDGGTTFNNSNGNLADLQFYGGAMGTTTGANHDATRRLGGLQDNGTVQTSGGTLGWSEVIGGDGGYATISTADNNVEYGEFTDAKVNKSTDGGASFTNVLCGGGGCTSNFIAPLVEDPAVPSTVLSGQNDLYETTDGGTTWNNITKGATAPCCGIGTSFGTISAIGISDTPQKTIYVGTNAGQTFVTTDDGTTWTALDSGAGTSCIPNPAPFCAALNTAKAEQITSMAADPKNADVVYATVSGFQGAQQYHVFKGTYDPTAKTISWSDISTTLPDEPFESVAVNPVNSNIVYAAGITGVFISQNAGASWSVFGSGLPNVAVWNLQVSNDGTTVDAFTHGRSAYEITGAGPTAAYVSHFSMQRHGSSVLFRWQMAPTAHLAGFNLYAGAHRLNAHLIRGHSGAHYQYHARRTGRAKFALTAVFASGRQVTVAGG